MASQTANERREVLVALRSVGVPVTWRSDALVIDDRALPVHVIERSHPTPDELSVLSPGADEGALVVVVADRLSKAARQVLRGRGWGWLDRRGKLRLWTPGLRIDTTYVPTSPTPGPRRVASVFSPVAREVAFRLLMDVGQVASPRQMAAVLDRSPGYISVVLRTFADQALIDDGGRPLCPEMFWALSDAWDRNWHYFLDEPDRIRDQFEVVPTGATAAVDWGAPVFLKEQQITELLVPDRQTLRRVFELCAAAPSRAMARTAVRVEPLVATDLLSLVIGSDRLTHPLACALDLATDPRGRETVEAWTPRHQRVALVGLLDLGQMLESTGWFDETWVEGILDQPLDDDLWLRLAAACWTRPECLALVYNHGGAPPHVTSMVRAQLNSLKDLMPQASGSVLDPRHDADGLLRALRTVVPELDPGDGSSSLRGMVWPAVRAGDIEIVGSLIGAVRPRQSWRTVTDEEEALTASRPETTPFPGGLEGFHRVW